MVPIHEILGIAAGILQFTALLAYIRAILRKETKPNKMTWWVLAILNTLISASYFVSGARETIWLPLAYASGFCIVAVLSVRYGEGTWGWLEKACLGGALVTIPIWWFSHSAALALFLNIAMDFMGLMPTMYKAYLRPWTEDRTAWIIALAASVLNLAAIVKWTPVISGYPLYVAITNAVVVGCILFRPKKRSVPS